MRIVILCGDDIFASMLMHPLLNSQQHHVVAILQQRDVMAPGKTPLQMFNKVKNQSGWRYALYQAIQTKVYGFLLQLNRRLALPHQLARQYQIPYHVFDRVHASETLQYIRDLQPNIILSLRFSQIIKKSLIVIPHYGILNFHASMLPQYRGLGSVFQAMAHNESEIGYTLHYVDEDIDTGRIFLQYRLPHQKGKSVSYHYVQLHLHGGKLVLDAVQYLEAGMYPATPVSGEGSYFSWPQKRDIQMFLKEGGKLLTIADLLWMLFCFRSTRSS